jgi:DNA-binding PadR family transcriptional regulator
MLELQERFPAYRASPGSVYPALNALEAEHLVAGEDEGDRRVYRVTATGGVALVERRALLAKVEARTGARLTERSAESALVSFANRVRPVVAAVDVSAVEKVLEDAAERIERLAKGGQP